MIVSCQDEEADEDAIKLLMSCDEAASSSATSIRDDDPSSFE